MTGRCVDLQHEKGGAQVEAGGERRRRRWEDGEVEL